MKQELLDTLVERELVNHNTWVYAQVQVEGLGGTPMMVKKDVYYNSDIPAEAIHDIEGMEPERFAKAYDIKPMALQRIQKKRSQTPNMSWHKYIL